MKRDLHQAQSLTAMHDKSAAWLSLGATGATLWKYRNILSCHQPERRLWLKDIIACGYITLVLMYLGGILGLSIVAPDLINLGDIVGNTTDVQQLTSFISNIGQDPNQYVISLHFFSQH